MSHPEICRNRVVESDERNVGSVSSPYRAVVGGVASERVIFGHEERRKYLYTDLSITPKNCFRVMVSLDKCVGVEFDAASHPPQFTYE